ncbi:MAG: type II secretion system protein [Pseudomonadota bacterium]
MDKFSINDKGVSLAELSIVIAIIGLLVTAVTKGQSIIAAAKIRSQISQIQNLRSAMENFRIFYDDLPGDISHIKAQTYSELIDGTGDAGRGDGNGIITGIDQGGTNYTFEQSGESRMAWHHLSSSGFFTEAPQAATTYTDGTSGWSTFDLFPKAKFDNSYLLFIPLANDSIGSSRLTNPQFLYKNYVHIIALDGTWGGGGSSRPDFKSESAMTTKEAYTFDSKIDDGFSLTGNIQPAQGTSVGQVFQTVTGCGSSGSYEDIGNTQKICNLVIKFD